MTDRKGFDLRQLLSLLAVLLLTPALRLFPSGAVRLAGRAAWLSPLLALPALGGYLWFLCRFLSHRREGEGLSELLGRAAGEKLARPVQLLTALWLLFYSGFVLRSGADRFITTVYPHSGPAFFVISMGLLGAVAALGAERSIVRAGRLVLPLLYGTLALALLAALLALKKENLLPVTGRDLLPAAAGALPVLDVVSAVMVLGAFFVWPLPKTAEPLRPGLRWLAAACILLCLLAAAILGSFGAELTDLLTQPFFYLVRNLVFFRNLERVEAFVVTLWVFPDFLMFSALLFAARRCLDPALSLPQPDPAAPLSLRGGRWVTPLSALPAILCGCLLAPGAESLAFFSERLIPGLNLGFAFILLPGLYLLGRVKKRI